MLTLRSDLEIDVARRVDGSAAAGVMQPTVCQDAPEPLSISPNDRRAELLRIAGKLFAQKGFERTTVRDISEAAGILSGSLYYHFDSKEAMVDEILRGFLEDLFSRYSDIIIECFDPAETLERVLSVSFDSIFKHHDAVVIYQAEATQLSSRYPKFGYLDDYNVEFRRNWTNILRAGVTAGTLRDDLDLDMTYKYLRDAVWSAVRWYQPGCGKSADEVSGKYFDLVMHGVGRA